MINCLIIDDEMHARERISNVINKRHGWKITGEATEYQDAKALLNCLKPYVCFLDINIIGGNGLDLIRELKHKTISKWVIMSAHSHYAIDGYELEVENYLLKPIDSLLLEKVLLTIESYFASKLVYDLANAEETLNLRL